MEYTYLYAGVALKMLVKTNATFVNWQNTVNICLYDRCKSLVVTWCNNVPFVPNNNIKN